MSKLKLSRRSVIKLGALTTVSLAIGLPTRGILKAGTDEASKKQKGFLYDQRTCVGCRSCEYACKETNKWEEGAQWRRVLSQDTNNGKVFLSISCNHCTNCACLKVCPVGAYKKREDGIVVHDANKCVGCKYCLYACPYHAPQYSEHTGRITKCHMCYARQDAGQAPACVSACPTKALKSGTMAELQTTSGGVAQLKGLPTATITKPSWVLIPKE